MRIISLFILLFASIILQAQAPGNELRANGIYLSATEYLNQALTLGFDKNDSFKFTKQKKTSISIVTDSTRQTYYFDNIWGYRKEGIDWRVYNNELYQVDYIGKICIYTQPDVGPILNPSWTYFSNDLMSPIHELSRKNLIAAFYSDSPFVKKINNLRWTISIYRWDKKNHRFQFINWLAEGFDKQDLNSDKLLLHK